VSEQDRKQARQYSLPVIMYLVVIVILMGLKNLMEIYQWMKNNSKRKEIKKLLGVEFFKAPWKSRVYDFFEIVDKAELEKAFCRWIRTFVGIPEHVVVAVDGKVLRGIVNAKENAVSILSAALADKTYYCP